MQGDFRTSFPCSFLAKGGSNLPEGQTPVGMFVYWLLSRHWRVQIGVDGMGEEAALIVAMVIPLASVVGWDQRRAESADVAWLAMGFQMGNVGRGGGYGRGRTPLTSRGRMSKPPSPPPAAQNGKPPHPQTQLPPLPRPRVPAPPQSTQHVSGPGGMWPSGCSSNGSSRSRGSSGRSLQRQPSRTWRSGPLRWTVTPCGATRSA